MCRRCSSWSKAFGWGFILNHKTCPHLADALWRLGELTRFEDHHLTSIAVHKTHVRLPISSITIPADQAISEPIRACSGLGASAVARWLHAPGPCDSVLRIDTIGVNPRIWSCDCGLLIR